MSVAVQNSSSQTFSDLETKPCNEINLFFKRQSNELKTPFVKRTNFGKQPLLNLFSNLSTSTSSTASRSESADEFQCPEKQFKFSQIKIDTNDEVEQKIHEWLDKNNVIITDPYDKVADYYHQLRIQAFNRFTDCYSIPESNSADSLSFQNVCPLNRNSSTLVMSSSPIIQRRTKIMSSDNRGEFNLRRNLMDERGDIVISEFQHA